MLVVRSYGRTVGHVSDCLVLGYLLEQDQHIVLDIGIAAVHPYIIGTHPDVVGLRGDSLLALDCRPEGALVQQGGFVQPRGTLGLDMDVHHILHVRIVGIPAWYHGLPIVSTRCYSPRRLRHDMMGTRGNRCVS